MIKEFNFKLKPAQAVLVYDLLLQHQDKLKSVNDNWYKTFEKILTDIESQYPGFKEYRDINSES